MKKILSFFACVALAFTSLIFTACGKTGYYDENIRIRQVLPTKVHVEYGNGVIYVKDGDDIYAKSGVYSMSGRWEVYVRENLEDGVFYWQGQGQHYISARWTDTAWENADEDTFQSQGWNANDMNHLVIYGSVNNTKGPDTSGYMLHGYSDVNSPLDTVQATQLENETITLESGQNVECVVWQVVFDYNGTYQKDKFWFAKDSHIYLKGLSVYDRDKDIDTEGSSYSHPVATYYAEGENMDDFLQTLDPARTRPDFSQWH